jgi:hypothetical protein
MLLLWMFLLWAYFPFFVLELGSFVVMDHYKHDTAIPAPKDPGGQHSVPQLSSVPWLNFLTLYIDWIRLILILYGCNGMECFSAA